MLETLLVPALHSYIDPKRNVLKLSRDLAVAVKVDPGNTGRVGPTEAALFLKKSGLPDVTLGKVGSECVCVSVCHTLLACSSYCPANSPAPKLPGSSSQSVSAAGGGSQLPGAFLSSPWKDELPSLLNALRFLSLCLCCRSGIWLILRAEATWTSRLETGLSTG